MSTEKLAARCTPQGQHEAGRKLDSISSFQRLLLKMRINIQSKTLPLTHLRLLKFSLRVPLGLCCITSTAKVRVWNSVSRFSHRSRVDPVMFTLVLLHVGYVPQEIGKHQHESASFA